MQKLDFVLVLKAEESRCTFQDFGQVSRILHFQLQTLIQKLSFEGQGVQVNISGLGQVSKIFHFQIQTLIQKLSFEG